MMNADQMRLEQIKLEYEQLRIEREEIAERLKLEKIGSDFALLDKIRGLEKHHAASNWEKLADDAAYISSAATIDLAAPLDKDFWAEAVEFAKMRAPYMMPEEFRMNQIKYWPGLNVAIGANPGVGKTTAALNLIYDCLAKKNMKVLFCTLEMVSTQVYIKLFIIFARMTQNKFYDFEEVLSWIKNPIDNKDNVAVLKKFFDVMKNRLLVVDDSRLTALRIIAAHEWSKNRLGKIADAVFVDYLQIVQPEPSMVNRQMREQMIVKSRLFTHKAKQTGTSYFLISQLNNDGQYREAANILDDIGLGIKLERKVEDDSGQYESGITIRVVKNRMGPLAVSRVAFDNATGVIGGFAPKV